MKLKRILLVAFAVISSVCAFAETDYTSLMTGTWTGSGGDFQGGREKYQTANYTADTKVMYQSITAPEDGIYEIKFYAVTSSTSGRGFENKWGDNIAVAYASAGSNEVTLPMSVINQVGCTLQEAGNIRTLSVEAKSGETIEYGLKNIAEGGNWYTIKGISIKMKTVAEIYQDTYDAAKAILDNSTETVDGAKATFAIAVSDMQNALNGTLADATAAAEALATAQATYCTQSFPTKGSGVKYDFTGRMNLAVNGWTCAQGNGPAAYGFTGATETYKGSAYTAGKVIYQSISGLPLGEYEVHFYGVANSPRNESKSGSGIAQAYANSVTLDIDVVAQDGCTPSDYERVLTCDVKDGNLEFGLKNVAEGGNWYVTKAIALYMVGGPDLSDYYGNIADNLSAANTAKTKMMNAIVLSDLNDAIAGAEDYNSVAVIGQLITINDNLVNALSAANTSIAYYEGITAKYNVLDAAGKAAFDATEIGTKYKDASLVNEDYVAAIATASKAQTSAGANMTGAIVNPCPESETKNANGWTIDTNSGNTPFRYGQFFEHYHVDAKNTFDYYQIIEGMPNGAYIVSADIWAEQFFDGKTVADLDGTVGVYGKGATEAQASATVEGKNSKATGEFIVTDGTLRIGVKNFKERVTKWFHADNFQLTYVRALTEEEIAQAEYDEAIAAANEVKTSWENKVGGIFQHTTETYEAVCNAIDNGTTQELKDAVTAFNNSMVKPEAGQAYTMSIDGLYMNLTDGAAYNMTLTSAAYGIQFEASGNNYKIKDMEGNYIRVDGSNQWYTDATASKSDFIVEPQADGTVMFKCADKTYAGWGWYLGAVSNAEGSRVAPYINQSTSIAYKNWNVDILSAAIERTTAIDKYGTICAPYAFTATGADIYSAAINGNEVELTAVSEPEAGKAYIYQATADAQTFSYASGAFVSEPVESAPLTGVFTATPVPVGSYVMQTKDDTQKFYIVAEGKQPTLSANRAYLTVPASEAKAFSIGTAEETAIKAIDALMSGDAKIYDMNGREQKSLQKGVNIVNGVKVLVK